MSLLPVSQNQCQLYAKRFFVYGCVGAGTRKVSPSKPGGTG